MLHGKKWKWIPYFAVRYTIYHKVTVPSGLVGGDGKFGHHLGLLGRVGTEAEIPERSWGWEDKH